MLLFDCSPLWPVQYNVAITGNGAISFIRGKQESFCNLAAVLVSFYCIFWGKQNWQSLLNELNLSISLFATVFITESKPSTVRLVFLVVQHLTD